MELKASEKRQGKTPTTTYHPSEILTRADVAKIFKISLVTVHNWTQCGVIQAYRLGSRIYFKRSEIDKAMTAIPSKNKGVTHG